MQDFIKEGAPAIVAPIQFSEDPAVPKKKNPSGVAGCKGIVSHHEDRGTQLLVDALDGGEQHLRRMAVQCTGGLIGQ